jgi:hypothetical protein
MAPKAVSAAEAYRPESSLARASRPQSSGCSHKRWRIHGSDKSVVRCGSRRPRREPPSRETCPYPGRRQTKSTSTRAPFARPVTPIHVRAGSRSAVK